MLTMLALLCGASAATAHALTTPTPPALRPSSGTPPGIAPATDCAMRLLSYNYSNHVQPWNSPNVELFDALQLSFCGHARPAARPWSSPWSPPADAAADARALFVDAEAGDDGGGAIGAIGSPLRTLHAALERTRERRRRGEFGSFTIVLRQGRHYLPEPLLIGAADSGLHFASHVGEQAEVTGAKPLKGLQWKPYNVTTPRPAPPALPPPPPPAWKEFDGENNVYGAAHNGTSTGTIKFLGSFDSAALCAAAIKKAKAGTYHSWTWHQDVASNQAYRKQCFGRTDVTWAPHAQPAIDSGLFGNPPPPPPPPNPRRNIYVADVSASVAKGIPIWGLRVDSKRGIRARYPNADPEISMTQPPWKPTQSSAGSKSAESKKGWIQSGIWTPPTPPPAATDLIAGPGDWPGVEWPKEQGSEGQPTCTGETGEANQGCYKLGTGGNCQATGTGPFAFQSYQPPVSYWCSNSPPRGKGYRHLGGGRGVSYAKLRHSSGGLPNAPYAKPKGAVVHAWRHAHWYSNQYRVGSQDTVKKTLSFDLGGFQGGEGEGSSAEWYIENVLEELDWENEWFYDEEAQKLYYFHNSTTQTPPPASTVFEAVTTKILYSYNGTQAKPVKDVSLKGITLRDTAYTYLDPHGSPSGGDWSLQKQGAITAVGTEGLVVKGCKITRCDGNALFAGGYHRGMQLLNNTVRWNGDTVFALWGDTGYNLNANGTKKLPWPVGPDGRGGNQPRGTKVIGNHVSEIGIFQKQSSFLFQAIATETIVQHNVHFNGPVNTDPLPLLEDSLSNLSC